MMKKFKLIFWFIAFSVPALAVAQNGQTANLIEAEKLYNAGKFEDAASAYEKIIRNTYADENLYYNLGNAYYRSGKIAEAVWCYEKTLLINPTIEDASFNLNIVRNKNGAPPATVDLSLTEKIISGFTFFSFSRYLIFMFGTLLLLLSTILLFLTTAEVRVRRRFFGGSMVLLPIFIYTIIGTSASYHDSFVKKEAIISPMSVNLKSSPDANGMDISIVYAGNKVSIKDKAGEWIKVQTANRAEGWINSESLLMLSSELPHPFSNGNSY